MLKVLAAAVLLMSGLASSTRASANTCTRQNSVPASVSEIATHPENYQCVRTQGIMGAPYLFANVDGIYVQPEDRLNPASSGLRVGLDNIRNERVGRYRHVEIIGRVQDCQSARDAVESSASQGDVVMVLGYCHYFNGPYLWVFNLRGIRGPRIERRLQNFGRKDYGDLKPAPADWPHRAEVETLAGQFLEALRSKNRRFNSEHIILLDGDTYDDPALYRATVCFCRIASCSARWPIASFDADNLPDRPYACSKIEPHLVSAGHTQPALDTPREKFGLAEPR